ELSPHRIANQNVGVSGICKVNQTEHNDRQQAQYPASKPALSGMNAQFTLDAHTIPQYCGCTVENLYQVAPGLFLNQHCRYDNLQIRGWHTATKLQQGIAVGYTEVLLLVDFRKFRAQWLSSLLSHNLDGCTDRVSRAQGARDQVESIRQLLVEARQSARSLDSKNKNGKGGGHDSSYQCRDGIGDPKTYDREAH